MTHGHDFACGFGQQQIARLSDELSPPFSLQNMGRSCSRPVVGPQRVDLRLDDVPAWRCATVVSLEDGIATLRIDATEHTEQVELTAISDKVVGSEFSARLLSGRQSTLRIGERFIFDRGTALILLVCGQLRDVKVLSRIGRVGNRHRLKLLDDPDATTIVADLNPFNHAAPRFVTCQAFSKARTTLLESLLSSLGTVECVSAMRFTEPHGQ